MVCGGRGRQRRQAAGGFGTAGLASALGRGQWTLQQVKPGERLVTVLVTLSVSDTADADDAATLIAVAADSTAIQVVHTIGVEGHLPVPCTTVLRGRQTRPWMVQSLTADAAILTDLAGGTIHVALTALHPDELESPTDPTLTTPHPTHRRTPHQPHLSPPTPGCPS